MYKLSKKSLEVSGGAEGTGDGLERPPRILFKLFGGALQAVANRCHDNNACYTLWSRSFHGDQMSTTGKWRVRF